MKIVYVVMQQYNSNEPSLLFSIWDTPDEARIEADRLNTVNKLRKSDFRSFYVESIELNNPNHINLN